MEKYIIAFFVGLVLVLCAVQCKRIDDNFYKSCVKDGIYSNELCYHWAYQE